VELRGARGWLVLTVDGVFDGVGGHNDAVIGLGVAVDGWSAGLRVLLESRYVRRLNVTFQKNAYSSLVNGLNTGLLIAVNFVETDVVLQIDVSRETRRRDAVQRDAKRTFP